MTTTPPRIFSSFSLKKAHADYADWADFSMQARRCGTDLSGFFCEKVFLGGRKWGNFAAPAVMRGAKK